MLRPPLHTAFDFRGSAASRAGAAASAYDSTRVVCELTDREMECLTWAARGKTEEEIGMIIHRSHSTARFHLRSAIRKLGASNRSHAIAIVCSRGLISVI